MLACLHDANIHKKIVAVANTSLEGNHQIEIITKLDKDGYILGFNSIEEFKSGTSELKHVLKG